MTAEITLVTEIKHVLMLADVQYPPRRKKEHGGGAKNLIASCLFAYEELMKHPDVSFELRAPYFVSLYDEFQVELSNLDSPDIGEDSSPSVFLLLKPATVWIGEDNPGMRKHKAKLMLGSIYKLAYDMQVATQRILSYKKLGETQDEIDKREALAKSPKLVKCDRLKLGIINVIIDALRTVGRDAHADSLKQTADRINIAESSGFESIFNGIGLGGLLNNIPGARDALRGADGESAMNVFRKVAGDGSFAETIATLMTDPTALGSDAKSAASNVFGQLKPMIRSTIASMSDAPDGVELDVDKFDASMDRMQEKLMDVVGSLSDITM